MKINIKFFLSTFLFALVYNLCAGQDGIMTETKSVVQRSGYAVMKKILPAQQILEKRDTTFKTANEEDDEAEETERRILQRNKIGEKPGVMPISVTTGGQNTNNISNYENPCVTYEGLNMSGFFPPDITSAVGFDHIFMATNDGFRVSDKNGNNLWQETNTQSGGFWATIDKTDLFDPVLTYDPDAKRWIYVIDTDRKSDTSAFLIAVSQGSDPLGGWYLYRIDADGDNNQWMDYPTVGFNNNWIVVSGNMFPIAGTSGSYSGRVWAINKSQLYAGGSVGYSVFNNTSYTSTIHPSRVYDASQNDLWCATTSGTNSIQFFKISGSASAPSFSTQGSISISGSWALGNNNIAPQSGTSTLIHAGDDRMLSVIWQNGKLYMAHTIFIGTPQYATIQFISANPSTATVNEAIRFTASSTSMYVFPFLAINANDDVVLSCSRFTSSTYGSACVLIRRNGAGWIENSYKSGEIAYNITASDGRVRWGDYTAAHIDPSDNQSIWLASEYAKSLPLPGSASTPIWGTWWAKLCSGVCASNITVTNPQYSGTQKKWEADNTVFANCYIQTGASIKLDGGSKIVLQPGFVAEKGSLLRTYLEGCGGAQ